MKLIAIPDIHGRADIPHMLADEIAAADWVLLPGDLTNGTLTELNAVLDAVRAYNENVLTVPGNMDRNVIHAEMIAEGINIHGSHRIIEGVAFLGLGGALPFYGTFVFEEPQLATLLDATLQSVPDIATILVSHQPPYGTVTDKLRNGQQVGSHSVRAFIEQHQPLICFTGHIHEAVGIDNIGDTQIVNPGRGGYALAEIDGGGVKTLTHHRIPQS